MKDLENAILEIIRRLYCCEYVGQITVKQLQSYHECDNSGYELVLGLNCNDKPLRLVSNAANEEEFLKYIVNELRERQLHLTRYFKKYHYDECTTAYELENKSKTITPKPYYTPKYYTITFQMDAHSYVNQPDIVTICAGQNLEAIITFDVGYLLDTVCDMTNASSRIFLTDIQSNYNFNIKSKAIVYNITYHLYDNITETDTYTVEDYKILPIPTRPGYSFDAWFLNPTLSGPIVNVVTGTGDKHYYARWGLI